MPILLERALVTLTASRYVLRTFPSAHGAKRSDESQSLRNKEAFASFSPPLARRSKRAPASLGRE